ncbi:Branched-chain amino acid transport ATP-binding protein LivG (TC 3.A.1.4.1) [Olavius algarvensis associated proteobacterium Delta 3]|nr:Branched-chain amino acid transport ATP-binding protein LivG (TC 3.A.1.4.1) [Olavius algarvensis associated proteobacterium Delta 3]
MHALVLDNVSKSFGGIDAVSNVDLTITVGESRALIGPNGAGKTTLFNLVTGEIPVDEGRVLLFDRDLTREPVQKRIASQLGRTYQMSNLFDQLTVQENLFLASWQTRRRRASVIATLFRSWRRFENQRRHIEAIARRVGLDDKLTVPVNELSHGEHRQLELGITLAHKPRILLLDEPMAGLSAAERGFMTELIMDLKPEITVVIIEHDIDVAFSIGDQVSVLDHGTIVAEGTPEQIVVNQKVQEIYTLSRQN